MNNKPVAWMLVDEINGDYMLERHPSGDYDWIPLYTHPVKELTLTSEQVRKIAVECGAYVNEDTGSLYPDDMCIDSFVKAILRKAEK